MSRMIDYKFEFGKFNNMSESYDPRYPDEGYKILALTHILQTRPGTYQDNPDIGLDISGIQFTEIAQNEANDKISFIQNEIIRQANMYIGDNFIESVEINMTDNKTTTTDGSKNITMNIKLRTGTVIDLESVTSNAGLQHRSIKIDKTPFTSA
jgi:hypothetical protein